MRIPVKVLPPAPWTGAPWWASLVLERIGEDGHREGWVSRQCGPLTLSLMMLAGSLTFPALCLAGPMLRNESTAAVRLPLAEVLPPAWAVVLALVGYLLVFMSMVAGFCWNFDWSGRLEADLRERNVNAVAVRDLMQRNWSRVLRPVVLEDDEAAN